MAREKSGALHEVYLQPVSGQAQAHLSPNQRGRCCKMRRLESASMSASNCNSVDVYY